LNDLRRFVKPSAPETVVRGLDVGNSDASAILAQVFEELGGADLVIISAGTGYNEHLHWQMDLEVAGT
jgi:hypothetical protein